MAVNPVTRIAPAEGTERHPSRNEATPMAPMRPMAALALAASRSRSPGALALFDAHAPTSSHTESMAEGVQAGEEEALPTVSAALARYLDPTLPLRLSRAGPGVQWRVGASGQWEALTAEGAEAPSGVVAVPAQVTHEGQDGRAAGRWARGAR